MVIVDSRPFEEYHRMNIPTATDMPGAELAFRIHDIAPDPETFVVVNCAGRTRSIIGAQSLINAGIPNPVAALKDGTMGWHLAGFELELGSNREASQPGSAGMEKALAAAGRILVTRPTCWMFAHPRNMSTGMGRDTVVPRAVNSSRQPMSMSR